VLRDYILFDSTGSLNLPTIGSSKSSLASTDGMSPFDPGVHLQWSRIPVGVLEVANLATKMRFHLERILQKNFNARVALPAQNMTGVGAFRGMQISPCVKEFRNEGSVHSYASILCHTIIGLYRDLTGQQVYVSARVPANGRAVVTDKTIELKNQIRLLWEDKAPYIFDRHLAHLRTSLAQSPNEPISFPWIRFSWEGWQAILGKVFVVISIFTYPIHDGEVSYWVKRVRILIYTRLYLYS
jgi:hypothetical protein